MEEGGGVAEGCRKGRQGGGNVPESKAKWLEGAGNGGRVAGGCRKAKLGVCRTQALNYLPLRPQHLQQSPPRHHALTLLLSFPSKAKI